MVIDEKCSSLGAMRAEAASGDRRDSTVRRHRVELRPVMICAPAAKRSSFRVGSVGAEPLVSAARTAQMITRYTTTQTRESVRKQLGHSLAASQPHHRAFVPRALF